MVWRSRKCGSTRHHGLSVLNIWRTQIMSTPNDSSKNLLKESGSQGVLLDPSSGALSKYRRFVVGSDDWWYFVKFELITSLFVSWPGAMGLWFRQKFYPLLFKRCGKNVVFGRNLVIRHPLQISLGDNVVISDEVTLDAKGDDGQITIDDSVFIGKGTILTVLDGLIEVGRKTSIGCYCRIGSTQQTRIGRDVLIAAYVYILGADHETARTDIPIIDQPNISLGGASVGDGAWIGTKSTVLDGVQVGANCVVGGHSLVTKSIPDFAVAVGTPAEVIKSRLDDE